MASEAQKTPSRPTAVYARITEVLRRAIDDGGLAPGTVILEGPVADILHSTRTPVRQALLQLEDEGLVSRFAGRGYLAGPSGVAPRRVAITAAMLGQEAGAEPVRKKLGWKAVYDLIERELVHLSVFGSYRVNEFELARHMGIGRAVARDVLLRLESLGLVEKDDRLRWAVTPLDATRLNQLYELRWLLEPVALRAAAKAATETEIAAMQADLRRAMRAYPKVTGAAMDKLELDLHVNLLARCPNRELLHSLQRTRCVLTLSKHALGSSAPMPKRDPFMTEHQAVLDALAAGDVGAAEQALRAHLEASCVKVIERVALVQRTYATPELPYVSPH